MRNKINIPKENILDKAIKWINPEKGFKRMKARSHMALAGVYTGARKDKRQTKTWYASSGSADADTQNDLPNLRDRSRDLVRNTPLARGAINTVVTNAVGTGLKVQSRIQRDVLKGVLGNTEEQMDAWERNAERIFKNWAASKDCDVSRNQNFVQMQALVFRSALESGDSFALRRFVNRGQKLGTALQIIEADRVVNNNFGSDTKTMVGGVEMDANGAPIAYYISKRHPGDDIAPNYTTSRFKAFDKNGLRQVYHIYYKERPGLTRGVPYLASVIEQFKTLDKYTEAELMAALVSGLFTVFIKSESGQSLNPFQPQSETTRAGDDDFALGNGAVVDLMPEESIETANPGRPNQAFDPFVMSILRQIGSALEIPFEILIKHFTASFSASQAAIVEAWKFFITRRQWLVDDFCNPVYEAVISEAVANGFLEAPGFFEDEDLRKAYLGAEWVGMPRTQIDQKKEIDAAEKRIALGVTTISEETASLTGKDWERNHPQTVKETIMRREVDLPIAGIKETVSTSVSEENIETDEI